MKKMSREINEGLEMENNKEQNNKKGREIIGRKQEGDSLAWPNPPMLLLAGTYKHSLTINAGLSLHVALARINLNLLPYEHTTPIWAAKIIFYFILIFILFIYHLGKAVAEKQKDIKTHPCPMLELNVSNHFIIIFLFIIYLSTRLKSILRREDYLNFIKSEFFLIH